MAKCMIMHTFLHDSSGTVVFCSKSFGTGRVSHLGTWGHWPGTLSPCK